MPMNKPAALAVTALALLSLSSFALAQGVTITPDPALSSLTPEEMVVKREDIMKSNGGTLRAAGSATGADAVAAADTLIANFSNLTVLFPEGSMVGETKALPAIWENNAAFMDILTRAVTAATAMKAAAEAGDTAAYGEAIKTIGATCGECHQQFRAPS